MAPVPLDISAWRNDQRRRLIALRNQMEAGDRADCERRMKGFLNGCIPHPADQIVAVYSPIHGEPDLTSWMYDIHARGVTCALPVVTGADRPLQFHRWAPGAEMKTVALGISIPAVAIPVQPDVVIAPMIGFDANRYRLGFGGGFYDRTFAQTGDAVTRIGVAFAACQLPTIHPRPHDIPMNAVVTENGVF